MKNKVSLLIPVFNRAEWIAQTLESILRQTHTDWECLVVDDGSTDSTRAVVLSYCERDARFRLFTRPDNRMKGPNACRNYGFEQSTGSFIYFFDSDDLLLPEALATYLFHFDSTTEAVIAPLQKISAKDGRFLSKSQIYSENLIEAYFIGTVSFYVCGPMWRRSFLEQQPELFDEELRNLDDWDFNLRMLYAQPQLQFLTTPLVQYRQHDKSLKQELSKGNPEEIASAYRARFKHLALLTTQNPAQRPLYQRHIARFYRKTLRRALIGGWPWWGYYKSLTSLLFQTHDFAIWLRVSLGVVLLLTFKKGYRLLD